MRPECIVRRSRHAAAAVAATLFLLPATPALPQQAGGGATEVGVMTLESRDEPVTVTVPGRAVAYEQVDVRPRVGGAISEVVYELGRPVEAGDVLFRIEDQTYRAEVALAEASVAAAQETVTRYERLLGTGVTQEDLATAQVSLKQAQADQSAAEAALEVAQLDLDRTEIRNPIAGFPSVPTISVGRW